MTTILEEDIIIATPIGTKLNIIKDMVITNPIYGNKYDGLFEELHITDFLSWLEGEDRENYIRLEEQHNPVQFKIFRKAHPELFE